MMYFTPQKYKCPKCDYEFKWSEHNDIIGLGKPFCHSCYLNFISSNVPLALKQEE